MRLSPGVRSLINLQAAQCRCMLQAARELVAVCAGGSLHAFVRRLMRTSRSRKGWPLEGRASRCGLVEMAAALRHGVHKRLRGTQAGAAS